MALTCGSQQTNVCEGRRESCCHHRAKFDGDLFLSRRMEPVTIQTGDMIALNPDYNGQNRLISRAGASPPTLATCDRQRSGLDSPHSPDWDAVTAVIATVLQLAEPFAAVWPAQGCRRFDRCVFRIEKAAPSSRNGSGSFGRQVSRATLCSSTTPPTRSADEWSGFGEGRFPLTSFPSLARSAEWAIRSRLPVVRPHGWLAGVLLPQYRRPRNAQGVIGPSLVLGGWPRCRISPAACICRNGREKEGEGEKITIDNLEWETVRWTNRAARLAALRLLTIERKLTIPRQVCGCSHSTGSGGRPLIEHALW